MLNNELDLNKKLKVACIQMDCVSCGITDNYERARAFTVKAAKAGAKLIVLPEMYNVGYELNKLKEMKYDNEYIFQLAELSNELGVYIVGGVFEKHLNMFYNSAVVFDDTGKLLHTYRKINLFPLSNEADLFQAGENITTFQIKGFRFGIQICYDIRFPKLSRRYAENECNVLLILSAFPHPRLEHWKVLLRARAIENQVYVIAANRVGTDGDMLFCGNSCVINPWGEVTGRMNGMKEGVLIREIDLELITHARKMLPCNLLN